jgi:hypothetical protein
MEDSLEDSYLEKISGAIVIVPDSTKRKVYYFRGVQEGKLAVYSPELKFYANDFRGESSKINSLIDKKVVFIPLKTEDEQKTYMNLRVETRRIPLEFEVSSVDKGIEKVVSKIKAETYNPFTQNGAKRVRHFVRRYIYPRSFLKYE